jgi:hypothetical protein
MSIIPGKNRSCVGKWLKLTNNRPRGPEILLAIIETARKQGTGDPVPYITAALAKEFPPPADPRTFSREKWVFAAKAATNTKDWPVDWGPRPGEAGCLMPEDLITPELKRAVSVRRVA